MSTMSQRSHLTDFEAWRVVGRPKTKTRSYTATNTQKEASLFSVNGSRHRNMNATLLQQHLHSATGTTVSIQTVRNRLHGVGLYACRPLSPYAAAIGDDFILMDDNCRPHRASLVEDFLFKEGIVRMEWLESIEHVWNALGRRVAGPPTTPTNSKRTGKSSSERVGQNTYPNS
ncbi:transposable element Tcb2 transposase [Trichonephila clavipes]|nr:transposable element Tcb2 transposase [Trichonephila clavipes]